MFDDLYANQYEEDRDFHYTSDAEWDAAEADDIGRANPHLAWVYTGRDICHANPYYKGPAVPHPEEEAEC